MHGCCCVGVTPPDQRIYSDILLIRKLHFCTSHLSLLGVTSTTCRICATAHKFDVSPPTLQIVSMIFWNMGKCDGGVQVVKRRTGDLEMTFRPEVTHRLVRTLSQWQDSGHRGGSTVEECEKKGLFTSYCKWNTLGFCLSFALSDFSTASMM